VGWREQSSPLWKSGSIHQDLQVHQSILLYPRIDYSRYIVHWEIREKMEEQDVEVVVARALEKNPGVKPRIISDNGPQFIAKDFKNFIRFFGLSHVRTSPYYPQSNGKLERFHGILKRECIRQGSAEEHPERRANR
jgi:putative transposase